MTQLYCPNCKKMVDTKKGNKDLGYGLVTGFVTLGIGWVAGAAHHILKHARCPICNVELT